MPDPERTDGGEILCFVPVDFIFELGFFSHLRPRDSDFMNK